MIHVDGTSAVSKKRLVKRHEFYSENVHSVMLETAGTVDLDVEIKFKDREISYLEELQSLLLAKMGQ